MEVQDRMTKDPVTIRTGLTARDAAELMRARKIRHLPVVDEQGRAVRARFGNLTAIAEQVSVDEIMTTPAISVSRYDDLAEAAKIMHERKIGALPWCARAGWSAS